MPLGELQAVFDHQMPLFIKKYEEAEKNELFLAKMVEYIIGEPDRVAFANKLRELIEVMRQEKRDLVRSANNMLRRKLVEIGELK